MAPTERFAQALDRGELVFHYQPKVSFLTGHITGAEALLRWPRSDGSFVPAGDFMPHASADGLVSTITRRMFPRLVEDLHRIRACGRDTRVAFNVSALDLGDGGLVAMIRDAVSSGGIDAGCLEIEVTEGTAVSASPAVVRSLTGLLAAGVSLSMDDYGVGFSSLETLNRLPFSALKMDQSFVLRMLRSPKSAILVKTSIAMAQLLGLRTVVEGIESEDVYRTLLHYGCDEGQGYWISPPRPLAEFLALLDANPRWASSPVGMLRMAQLTHSWQLKLLMDTLLDYVQGGPPAAKGAVPAALHIGHHDCALGQWFYGPGKALAGHPEFAVLEAPHRALHDFCGELLAEIEGGLDPSALRGRLLELSDRSAELSAALQRLETRLLLAELG